MHVRFFMCPHRGLLPTQAMGMPDSFQVFKPAAKLDSLVPRIPPQTLGVQRFFLGYLAFSREEKALSSSQLRIRNLSARHGQV